MRIAVVGAGAVGGYIGAHLVRAGRDATFIDGWPAHVEAMREGGLRIAAMEPDGCFAVPVRALHVADVPQLAFEAPFDVAFIAVKSYDTAWATALVLPFLAPQGVLVSAQNSINEDTIAGLAGWSRVLGCSVGLHSAELVAPGHVQRNSLRGDAARIGMKVGEPHGRVTPRAEMVAEMVGLGDSAKVTTNLWGDRWSKLVINAMRNATCAMTGLSSKERDLDEPVRRLSIRLGSQAVRVGRAMGLALEPMSGLDLDLLARAEHDAAAMAAVEAQIAAVNATRNDASRPSMGQDIRKGRRTETGAINGLVARRGAEVGVDAALHGRVDALMRRIERGELRPAREHALGL
ncbi:ketopantoate reductase family protein [Falsiroseomonas sp. CW058]|uniref:ketopantoate reductase family protein n=1 Tax=Falsiroseomonas sp. CW058 TaxID=3388664 RepID=UPI003D31D634